MGLERDHNYNNLFDQLDELRRRMEGLERSALRGTIGPYEPDLSTTITGYIRLLIHEEGVATPYRLAIADTYATSPVAVDGSIPVGGIIAWSGKINDIPAHWHLCDGTEGTPNLLDRFILAAGSTYAVGETGGAATVDASHTHAVGTLDAAAESAHTHGVGTLDAAAEAAHTHAVGTLDAAAESSHTHAAGGIDAAPESSHTHGDGTLAADAGGAHQHPDSDGTYYAIDDTHDHTLTKSTSAVQSGSGITVLTNVTMATDTHQHDVQGVSSTSATHTHTVTGTTAAGSTHDHVISGTSAAGSSHDHALSGSTAAGSSHDHALSGSTAAGSSHDHALSGDTATGGSATEANMPPYYALAWIMRIA